MDGAKTSEFKLRGTFTHVYTLTIEDINLENWEIERAQLSIYFFRFVTTLVGGSDVIEVVESEEIKIDKPFA